MSPSLTPALFVLGQRHAEVVKSTAAEEVLQGLPAATANATDRCVEGSLPTSHVSTCAGTRTCTRTRTFGHTHTWRDTRTLQRKVSGNEKAWKCVLEKIQLLGNTISVKPQFWERISRTIPCKLDETNRKHWKNMLVKNYEKCFVKIWMVPQNFVSLKVCPDCIHMESEGETEGGRKKGREGQKKVNTGTFPSNR